ncbi:hypothetical protein EVAR_73369_1 [Eumeta japonica]|uniref:Uncharacterized protein n=1 Tax=Eumeta variegata TaxID=151549 RepID=A0A4C1T1E8_EUMVA|nr:hypothetical protein EVAR_73369_1 [Eumeta japonica]
MSHPMPGTCQWQVAIYFIYCIGIYTDPCFELWASLPEAWHSEQCVGRQQHLKIIYSPESTCSLVKHMCGQGLQNLFTTSHHVSAAQAPQPIVGEDSPLGVTDLPPWYQYYNPRVGTRRTILRKGQGILSSEESAANPRPRLSQASIPQKQNVKVLRQAKTQPAPEGALVSTSGYHGLIMNCCFSVILREVPMVLVLFEAIMSKSS